MKFFRFLGIFAVVISSVVFVACGSSGCAIAAPIAIVERGGGSGGGFSGGISSGARSSSSFSSGSRSSGSGSGFSGSSTANGRAGNGSGFSGSKPNSVPSGTGTQSTPIGVGQVSGSHANTYTNPVTHTVTHVYVPASIGSSYSYGGSSFFYHPEAYWLHLGGPNPNNPYDTRNYSNPYSPFYRYHMAYAGSC